MDILDRKMYFSMGVAQKVKLMKKGIWIQSLNNSHFWCPNFTQHFDMIIVATVCKNKKKELLVYQCGTNWKLIIYLLLKLLLAVQKLVIFLFLIIKKWGKNYVMECVYIFGIWLKKKDLRNQKIILIIWVRVK